MSSSLVDVRNVARFFAPAAAGWSSFAASSAFFFRPNIPPSFPATPPMFTFGWSSLACACSADITVSTFITVRMAVPSSFTDSFCRRAIAAFICGYMAIACAMSRAIVSVSLPSSFFM